MKNQVHIIMYHYVRALPLTRYPAIKGLLKSQFVVQLDMLNAEGYTFVSAKQVIEAANGGDALPEKSVLLTFDDGYIDHFTNVFSVLHERKIPAFFSMPGKIIAEQALLDVNRIHFLLASSNTKELITQLYNRLDYYRGSEYDILPNEELYKKLAQPTRFDDADTIFIKRMLQVELDEGLRNLIAKEMFAQFVSSSDEAFVQELYLSLDQVRMMARCGMEWGIHGYEHYWMNCLTPEGLEKDIDKALDVFDGVVPRKDWMCCYPYGSVSDDVVSYTSAKGSSGGFTTVVAQADLARDDIFRLPRWDTNDFPPKSRNFEKIKNEEMIR